jgi:hypothetical protein
VEKLDLAVRQEVPFVFGGKIVLLMDVENVLNLIDSDWGTIRQVGFPYAAPIANVTCANTACTQYQFANRAASNIFTPPVEATQINGSLWGVRFGVRLTF